jgi:predicted small secreted protein
MISTCLALVLLGALYGCETVKGLGRDITNAGEAIEDATR